MLRAYYNEFDPKAAEWLRQLIKNGNITPGEVDERSITEVKPDDLRGFDRCHFFAGIGTWDYCLTQAGWGDKPIWTASLPCQPFSAAGKGLGKADERHLLPHFLELVRECKPYSIVGEQVERAIAHGWLDDLQANMETEGYAVGHCVLGAHSINAPHIRQRLYWVANSHEQGLQRRKGIECPDKFPFGQSGMVSGMANSKSERIGGACRAGYSQTGTTENTGRYEDGEPSEFIAGSSISGMGNTEHNGRITSEIKRSDGAAIQDSKAGADCAGELEGTGASKSLSWIYCRDNKYRPIKPGILPLVDGSAGSVVHSSDPSAPIDANATQEGRGMRLKGYGNAIQAQTAIAFITAFMSI